MMDDDSRIRTEEPSEDEEKRGFLRPLPGPEHVPRQRHGKAMVKFLGVTMSERLRDLIVAGLMPLLAAIVDTAVYMAVVVEWLPDTMTYMFLIPLIAAIPIGLVVSQVSKALISGIGAGLLFLVLMALSVTTPAFMSPAASIGDFFFSGLVFSAIYFLFVVFASLIGTLIGILVREFF